MLRAWLTNGWLRIKALLRRRQLDRDLEEELRFHLAMREEKLRADAMGVGGSTASANARVETSLAHSAARKRFGNVTLLKERCREMWTFASLESFFQDLRYGFRMLHKSPGFTAVAVLTLALGIGANTIVLSMVSGLLLRPPSVKDPDSLMIVCSKDPANVFDAVRAHISVDDYLDWRALSTVFSGMAAADFGDFSDFNVFTISGDAPPERADGARISYNFFQVLGIPPILGRSFLPDEDRPGHDNNVVVLSNDIWHSRFASDPRVLGRTVLLNGKRYTIVGVLPSSFRLWDFDAQIWIPLVFSPDDLRPAARASRNLRVFARLKPSMTEKLASGEMAAIAQRLSQAHPETNKNWGATVMSLQEYSIADANAGPALVSLMAAAGFVLLIACANLAGILLARNSARRQEFSIRAVLGAGRLRLARQLLTECLLLSAAGAGLGILFAQAGIRAIVSEFNWNAAVIALASEFTIDTRVLLLTAGVCVFTALILAIAPAMQFARRDPGVCLGESGRSATPGRQRHRLQRLLVAGQIALSLILLTGAGFFVEEFFQEIRAATGFNPSHLLTASVSLRSLQYFGAPQRESEFYESALRQIRTSAQAQSAAATSDLPFTFPGSIRFVLEGHPVAKPSDAPLSGYADITPGYFQTLGVPLLQGRAFTSSDGPASSPVAIIDQAFAARYFPGENPIGRHLQIDPTNRAGAPWSEIIGVVGDVKDFLGESKPRPHLFEPFLAHPTGTMSFVVRTRSAPAAFSDPLRQAIWATDAGQAVSDVKTMARVISDSGQGDNIMAYLMAGFSALALALAGIGIYGVLSYLVAQRTHEIGIRMALGAEPRQVLALVLRNGMLLIGAGLVVGFLISLALPQVLRAAFGGIPRNAMGILGAAALLVIVAGFSACYVPARRAMRADPMVALRYE